MYIEIKLLIVSIAIMITIMIVASMFIYYGRREVTRHFQSQIRIKIDKIFYLIYYIKSIELLNKAYAGEVNAAGIDILKEDVEKKCKVVVDNVSEYNQSWCY